MSTQLIVLDLDGTILDSLKHVYNAVCAVFKKERLNPPTFIEYLTEFHNPWIAAYRRFGVRMPEDEIHRIFEREMNQHKSFPLFPDVKYFLERYHGKNGHVFAVLSANTQTRVDTCLEFHGIKGYFTYVIGGSGKKTPHLVRLREELGIERTQMVFIGDALSDMSDADEAQVPAIGIVRYKETDESLHFRDSLKKAGAHRIVSDLVSI